MDRQTVTTFLKANGAKIFLSTKESSIYILPDNDKIYELRDSLPFRTMIGSKFGHEGISLHVYFSQWGSN